MERLASAVTLNNHGIAAMMDTATAGSRAEALGYFMESLVTLQALLSDCRSSGNSDNGDNDDDSCLPPISVDVVALPVGPCHPTHGNQLHKAVAFDAPLFRDTDDCNVLQLDVLQVFSAAVIFNISLWYHAESQEPRSHEDRQQQQQQKRRQEQPGHNDDPAQCQEKARLLYEKACLCLPEHNRYEAYAMMLRLLSIHNLGVLYQELATFDKARDCARVVREMVIGTGDFIPRMLGVDTETFVQNTAVFLSEAVFDSRTKLHAAAA